MLYSRHAASLPANRLLPIPRQAGRYYELAHFTRVGILIVIVFLALSFWALFALLRRLWRQRVSSGWWVAFGVFVIGGVALGIWCAFVEYHIGTRYRIGSFPIPTVFFHLEHGDWVDFPVPEFQAWAAFFTNVITITALATLPLWLISWRQRRHESPPNAASSEGSFGKR